MYCPNCLNNSLNIKESGVCEISINDKKMDSGRFLYQVGGRKEETYEDARKKLNEFVQWLSNFSNLDPVKKVKFLTADVKCENGCATAFTKISVVGEVLSQSQVNTLLAEIGEKYNMELILDE